MRYISLFSGIEAATVAWQTLGWEPVAYAEIEPFWNEIKWGCYKKAVKVLADKINEIEKDGE